MAETRKRAKRAGALLGAGVLVALTATTGPLLAAAPRVSLGEVSTRVVRADVDLGEVLRAAVLEQLETLVAPRGEGRGPVVLSAALVRMEVDGGRVTCVVSATLRTARGGTMIAIVEGRAGLETEAPLTLPLVRQAVEAATRAAIVRVPEALR
jgi:hypothetical protein